MLLRGCEEGKGCRVSAHIAQVSTSTGWLYNLVLLAHLGHQAPASVNRPSYNWAHPAGLFWGSRSAGPPVHRRQGSLAFQPSSYSSRSFCPKGSCDVQNRLWCQYESSIVGLGTDNALGRRLFINLPGAHGCLSLSEFKLKGLSSCKSKRLAQADKNHPEGALYL